MDKIGNYYIKPFSKYRQNIVLITKEGWRKHCVHTFIEVDVTDARKKICKIFEKTGEKYSFTGWICKCVAQTLCEHKDLNAYRLGRRKIVVFDDVDIGIPVERMVNGEPRPLGYVLRKANEKTVSEITKEIRAVQKEEVDESISVLGKNLTGFEKFVLKSPLFLKKLFVTLFRRNGLMKKKHIGTIGVTAIGMKGRFPGGVIPMGASTNILVVGGGIIKKPGVIKDKIAIREYLHLTITADHEIVDGGPLARFVQRLTELMERSFELTN
ncbi:MAG: 2-oxo acid dehydrogenase subunit E2 [Thermoplasmatales archaeon]|nr:2-oxo acid dehydrogenase subunit E2 [Thermoplasmatales archaeon]